MPEDSSNSEELNQKRELDTIEDGVDFSNKKPKTEDGAEDVDGDNTSSLLGDTSLVGEAKEMPFVPPGEYPSFLNLKLT